MLPRDKDAVVWFPNKGCPPWTINTRRKRELYTASDTDVPLGRRNPPCTPTSGEGPLGESLSAAITTIGAPPPKIGSMTNPSSTTGRGMVKLEAHGGEFGGRNNEQNTRPCSKIRNGSEL